MTFWKKNFRLMIFGLLLVAGVYTINFVRAQISSNTNIVVTIQSLYDAIRINSTIDGTPPTQNTGGIINITVTVLGFGGTPLAGQTVDLTATGLPGAVIIGPTLPTDASGRTTATLTSAIAGTVTVTGVVTTYPGHNIPIDDNFVGVFTSYPLITITSVAGDTTPTYYDYTDDGLTTVIYTTSPLASECKWDVIDTDFDSMANTCLSTTQCDLNLTGLGNKRVYMRCTDLLGNKAPVSYVLDYIIASSPTPTPTPTTGGGTVPLPTPSPSHTPTPTPTVSPTITPTVSPSPTIPPTTPSPTPPLPSISPQPITSVVPVPGGFETPKVVPIIGWTFPNSNASGKNEKESLTGNSDLGGQFEFNFTFEKPGNYPTDINASFPQLGVFPKGVNIVIDEQTIKEQRTVYVLMPPTIQLSADQISLDGTLKIKGTSAPNIEIALYIYNQDTFRIYYLKSDQFGFWEDDFKNDLPLGRYTVYAVGNNQYNFVSLPSEQKSFQIIPLVKPTQQSITQFFAQRQVAGVFGLLQQLGLWVALGLILYSLFGLIFEIFNLILYILNQILSWLGIIPMRDPWGVVYDTETKDPVDLAVVRLYDAKTKKFLDSKVTNRTGRYGFEVKKGKYLVQVIKQKYLFPAVGNFGDYDGRYNHLYFGGEIEIKDDNQSIIYNIPITPKESLKKFVLRQNTYKFRKIRYYLGKLSFPLLCFGFMISVAIVLLYGGFLNYFVMSTYIVALIHRIYIMNADLKPWGMIYDSKTGDPIDLAIVYMIDPEYMRILETKVTDITGRFAFLVTPGKYMIKVEKEEYKFPSQACVLVSKDKHVDWYCGQVFEIKSAKEAFINIDIPLDIKPKPKQAQ